MDQRASPRLPNRLRAPYTVLLKSGATRIEIGEATLADLSRAGLGMTVDEPVPVPTLMQVQVQIPGHRGVVGFLGKSLYCVPTGGLDMYRVGLKFVGLLPTDLDSILADIGALQELAAIAPS